MDLTYISPSPTAMCFQNQVEARSLYNVFEEATSSQTRDELDELEELEDASV